MTELQKMGAAAKKAAAVLRTAGENKRTALNAAAAALRARQAEILAANKERGCAVPYGGQCRHSARRQGSVPLQ